MSFREELLNAKEDVEWLKSTHLVGHKYGAFRSFVIFGNDDAPEKVQLFKKKDPNVDDPYEEITLYDEDEGTDWDSGNRRKSNVEIVHDVMSYGSALKQIIVVTGIEKYVQMCIDEGPETFDNPMINGKAWISACIEIQREMREAYGGK